MHEPVKGIAALVDDEENIRETVGFALRRRLRPLEVPPSS